MTKTKRFVQHSKAKIQADKEARVDATSTDAAELAELATSGTEVESEPFAAHHSAGLNDRGRGGVPETDAALAAKAAESGTDTDEGAGMDMDNMYYHTGIEALAERVAVLSEPGTTGAVVASRYFVRDLVKKFSREQRAAYSPDTHRVAFPDGGEVLLVDVKTVDDTADLEDVTLDWVITDDLNVQDNARVQSIMKGRASKKAKKA